MASVSSISLIAIPHASMPGACGLTHQPTTPPASLATPHAPFGIVGLHDDRLDARDRAVLDLVLQLLGDLALVVQAALLEPEPGDVDQAGRVGGLPAAHRADERALDVQRVGADGLGEDVLGQNLAFLEQVRVLSSASRRCGGRRPDPPWPRCPRRSWCNRSASPARRRGGEQAGECPAAVGAAHFAFTIDWRVSSLATSQGSGNGFCVEADRPLDEVVVELDADLAQVVAQRRVLAERDEAAVTLDVDVLDAGARQFLGLAFPPDRAAAEPGEREVRPEDAAAGQPLAARPSCSRC